MNLWQAYLEATRPFVPVKGEECVHSRHCCIDHGCKYSDLDCPVWLGLKAQDYPCEYCWMDYEGSGQRPKIPQVRQDTIDARRRDV